MDISVILPTARDDYPIIGLPNVHVFERTFHSLEAQIFKDFELIVVDSLWPSKREWIEDRDWNFPIKYVPVHPNHRFWLDRKRWNVCGTLNTALIHAEGDLIVRVDDCSEFDEDYLKKFWEGYQSGYWPLAMHTRYKEGKQSIYNKKYKKEGYEFTRAKAHGEPTDTEKVLDSIFDEGEPVRDTRWPVVERAGGRMIAPVDWMYGYSSFTLDAALKVNGFDELFDGDKSLEDVDFGSRLDMAGYNGLFLLDVNHWVIEHEHARIPFDIISKDMRNIKCNYAIFLLNRLKRRWRANSEKLTEEDLDFIKEESLKPPCSPRPNFYDEDCEGELFKLWASNQPIFDLREERLEV